MATLTPAQALADALASGFSTATAPILVAIQTAESGLNTTALNPGHPLGAEYSVGISQINLQAHPEVTVAQAQDPLQADAISYRLSQGGTNFSPWSTYTSGAYKQYLNGSVQPDPIGGGSGIVGAVTGGANGGAAGIVASTGNEILDAFLIAFNEILDAFLKAFKLPNFVDLGYRALFIMLGTLLFVIGVVMFIQPAAREAAPMALELAA